MAGKPGMKYRELGDIITKVASGQKFSVVKTYCGHGINNLFHTAPNVPHYSKNKAVGSMKPGHTFTIEPMINVGECTDKMWPDNWTVTTTVRGPPAPARAPMAPPLSNLLTCTRWVGVAGRQAVGAV